MASKYYSDLNSLINPDSYRIMYIRSKQTTRIRYNWHKRVEARVEVGLRYRLQNQKLFKKVIKEM